MDQLIEMETNEPTVKPDPDDLTHSWGDTTTGDRGHNGGGGGKEGSSKGGANGEDEGSDDEGGDDVFEVERVVGHQHVPGAGLYYFLKWKDYEDKDSTWEPAHSVYCHGYVTDYWARYEAAGGSRDDRLHVEQARQDERRKSLTSASKNNANDADQGALLPDLTPLLTSTIDNAEARNSGNMSLKTPGKRRKDKTKSAKTSRRTKQGEKAVTSSGTNNATSVTIKTEISSGKETPSKRKRISEQGDWNPPAEWDWEDKVDTIEAVEERQIAGKRELVVHLVWKAGNRTEHLSRDVHRRCPEKLLNFYESHLIFREEAE